MGTEENMDAHQSIPGLVFTMHSYGTDPRQRVAVWQREAPSKSTTGYWAIYIHGGAWVDPRRTAVDFSHSIRHVIASDQHKDAIRGFMSLDYRISPGREETPLKIDDYKVQHPDHILDVRAALRYLDTEYDIDDKYILLGHSAGATLTFQLLMGAAALRTKNDDPAPRPAAVVGIAGIYDMVNLNKRFKNNYSGFLSSAFSDDEKVWLEASPAEHRGNFGKSMASKRPFILAASPEDELIDMPEMGSMIRKLEADGLKPDVVSDLHGNHDEIWGEGSQVAALIFRSLSQLLRKE